ncbi:MAG: hypothetical protein KGD73_03340 [Candidatus Lokiarchaeota archaeon]|nr:hypothetical protein [Candidatus Lokiarchaeota archaeon]
MTNNKLPDLFLELFDEKRIKKASEFPNNKISIISCNDDPIQIRSLVLDNDREFHIIIDEKKNEIFHDCPTFLFENERNEKICIHIIKLLLLLKDDISNKILTELSEYRLSYEDFGSKKKSKNFIELANHCLESNNCIEGLSYLNKAILNQSDCEPIIEKYLETSINNNLFIEFFEFLKNGYENELDEFLMKYNTFIESGFSKFMKSVSLYSFFDLLRIIESIDNFLGRYKFQNTTFLLKLTEELVKQIKSENFNEVYFSTFFVKKNLMKLMEINPVINELTLLENFDNFKEKILAYFFEQIDSFCVIDKLELMKKQFDVFEIPKEAYENSYDRYKKEIDALNRKLYLKKFAFIKLLIDKYKVRVSKVDLRKQRNTYIINHDKDNLKNTAYNYIINHIGFTGINNSKIKSSEIGINYLIIKELFSDDLQSFADIFYYQKQFWGEDENYEINPIDGYSLLSKPIEYNYDIDMAKNTEDVMIIEWDLASKPIQGSIVNAYGSQIMIPDQNSSLFHDLKPFDLCYCLKNPVKIEGNIIKTINVLMKCSFEDAINSIAKGMTFTEGYYPLSLVKKVILKEIDIFEAYELVANDRNNSFIPNYQNFLEAFKQFLFSYIDKDKELIFSQLRLNMEENHTKFLVLVDLTTQLAGMDLPYKDIINKTLKTETQLINFKARFLEEIHSYMNMLIEKKDLGSTRIFNLKKMHNTPFVRYIDKITKLRKIEFETSQIYIKDFEDSVEYDLSVICKTYYGEKILHVLKLENGFILNREDFKKFEALSTKLNLELKINT